MSNFTKGPFSLATIVEKQKQSKKTSFRSINLSDPPHITDPAQRLGQVFAESNVRSQTRLRRRSQRLHATLME